MLYKIQSANSRENGGIIMPATKQDIINMVLADKEISYAIINNVYEIELQKLEEEVKDKNGTNS